jgi:hypothetical protein
MAARTEDLLTRDSFAWHFKWGGEGLVDLGNKNCTVEGLPIDAVTPDPNSTQVTQLDSQILTSRCP